MRERFLLQRCFSITRWLCIHLFKLDLESVENLQILHPTLTHHVKCLELTKIDCKETLFCELIDTSAGYQVCRCWVNGGMCSSVFSSLSITSLGPKLNRVYSSLPNSWSGRPNQSVQHEDCWKQIWQKVPIHFNPIHFNPIHFNPIHQEAKRIRSSTTS